MHVQEWWNFDISSLEAAVLRVPWTKGVGGVVEVEMLLPGGESSLWG